MGEVVIIQFGSRAPRRRSLEQRKRDLVRDLSDIELQTLFQCHADAKDPQTAAYRLHRDAADEMRRRGITVLGD